MKKHKYRSTIVISFVITKILLLLFILVFNCSFDPTDIVFKNIKLIPELLDNEDRTPHLPKGYVNEKTEKLYDPLKLPKGKEKAPAEKIFSISDLINDVIITTPKDLKKAIPNEESLDNMLHLSKLGIIKRDAKKKGGGIKIEFLDPSTQTLPILNDFEPVKKMPKKVPFPPGLNAGTKKMEINNPITDIQINGIDDVLPNSVGAPFKTSDYTLDSLPNFFDDFIDKNYNLNQNVMDILP